MILSEFLVSIGFRPYVTVRNSWDAFNPTGSALMQLWMAPGQRVHDYPVANAYLRVCCWSAEHFALHGKRLTVGYNGRAQAIRAIEGGKPGYAALSNAPLDKQATHASGLWAKHADLTKVYPVLKIERPAGSEDVFAILASRILIAEIK